MREAPLPPSSRTCAARAERRADRGRALRGGNVFTDDRAPVEWLIDASIVSYAAGETADERGGRERASEPWGFAEGVVFVAGISTLGAEIAAARLIAPAFGASTVVWANTIAIVLVALAGGYWLGGRLADRHPHARGLARDGAGRRRPGRADPAARDPAAGRDRGSLGEFSGSLLVLVVLVAPPVLVLGALSPWAIRLRMRSVSAPRATSPGGSTRSARRAGSSATSPPTLVLIPWSARAGRSWSARRCSPSSPPRVAWSSRPA